MEISIYGDKLKVIKSIKEYIKEKVSKLNKYFKDDSHIKARVVAKIKGHRQIIEVTIFTSNFTLRAEEAHSNLYAAVDLVIDKLEGQIRKNKTKIQNRKAKGLNSDFHFDYNNKLEEEELKIVRRKRIELKPMDEEEAILQIEMLDHDFFIYKDIDSKKVCVLYRRKDGQYGVITTV